MNIDKIIEEFNRDYCDTDGDLYKTDSEDIRNFLRTTLTSLLQDQCRGEVERLKNKEHFTGEENFDDGFAQALEEEIAHHKARLQELK